MRKRKLFKLTVYQKFLKSKIGISLWLLATILIAAACSTGLKPANAPANDEAIQIPEETQFYIDKSREALAEKLEIDPEQIELESIIEPDTGDGTYIIKLVIDGKTYEYHGRGGEIRLILVSEPATSEYED
jgi:hypothetical protein